MIITYIAMIAAGVLTIGWGLWASFNLKKPYDIIGAICAPAGLILALIGTLLICVPGFFSG